MRTAHARLGRVLLGLLTFALLGSFLDDELEVPPLVRTAEIIVRAEVVANHRVPVRDPEVAAREGVLAVLPLTEYRVERAFLGATAVEPLFVVAESDGAGPGAEVVGESAILFLRPLDAARGGVARDRAQRAILRTTGDRPYYEVLDRGAWRVASGGEHTSVPVELALPTALREGERPAPTGALETWLDAAIERTTPTLVAEQSTTGPYSWRVAIEPDGTWTSIARETGTLEPEVWSALARTADSEAFFALPDQVGASRGPDEPSHHLTLRSRRGVKRVSLFASPGDPEVAATQREELELALSVWNRIPGSNRP